MKKFILIAIFASLFSLQLPSAHADWDEAGEAREAAQRKAEQQRAAKQKAEGDKMRRDANQKYMRGALGKDAVGKSDVEVERLHKQRMAQYQQQGAAYETAAAASEADAKRQKGRALTDREKAEAMMKSVTGKSTNDFGSMSAAERDAFVKSMEKQFAK